MDLPMHKDNESWANHIAPVLMILSTSDDGSFSEEDIMKMIRTMAATMPGDTLVKATLGAISLKASAVEKAKNTDDTIFGE